MFPQKKYYALRGKLEMIFGMVVFPVIAGVLQMFFTEISIICFGLTLGIIQVFTAFLTNRITMDELTQINNRTKLMQYLEGYMERHTEGEETDLHFLMIDLDDFKWINDTYGHVEGDRALIRIAGVLKKTLAGHAGILARYGGDEFCIAGEMLREEAEKRLQAIREFTEFGAGYRIAMRDLEIRGAGSLLGAEQSGHMIDVGYDMYLKLLEEAVLEERGEKPEQRAECAADLAVSANIPESYVPSQEQRMDLYRRIALVRSEPEADDLMDEVIDRFGDPPPSVYTLVQVALLRADAGKVGVTDISQKNGCLKFLLAQFDMQKVSALYARPEFKGRLKVDAGAKPGVILRLKTRTHVIEQARAFVSAWADAQGDRA